MSMADQMKRSRATNKSFIDDAWLERFKEFIGFSRGCSFWTNFQAVSRIGVYADAPFAGNQWLPSGRLEPADPGERIHYVQLAPSSGEDLRLGYFALRKFHANQEASPGH